MCLLIIAVLASLIWGENYGTYISWQPLFLTVTWLYPSIPVYTYNSLHFSGHVSNQWEFQWAPFNNLDELQLYPRVSFFSSPWYFPVKSPEKVTVPQNGTHGIKGEKKIIKNRNCRLYGIKCLPQHPSAFEKCRAHLVASTRMASTDSYAWIFQQLFPSW